MGGFKGLDGLDAGGEGLLCDGPIGKRDPLDLRQRYKRRSESHSLKV